MQQPASAETLDPIHDPIDDADEETVADPVAPEDEPTTIRPTPLPPRLTLWEAATMKDASHRETRPRGRVGKYELHTRLARGAFGVVYTARDPSLERDVAIKVLRPTHLTNHDVVQRFLQEARATARIGHPGIVTIHDCGTVDTRRGATAFIAMELLSGESLSTRLARAGRLDPAAACEIIRQVASALEAAHHADVLHRDLKPDNIYLVPDPAMPSGERVKVLDFGLAKLGTGGQTQLQLVFGTPRYMSPEQSRSATQIDHRSDIYSLGCILYELVTGRPVFDGDVRQLIERHQRATPPRAASLMPEVPAVLDDLIADMLAKDPRDRPPTMRAVQRALRTATDGPRPAEAPAARSAEPAPPSLPLPAPANASHAEVSAARKVRPPSSPPVRPSAPALRPPSSPPVRPPSSSPVRPPSSPPALTVVSSAPPRVLAVASSPPGPSWRALAIASSPSGSPPLSVVPPPAIGPGAPPPSPGGSPGDAGLPSGELVVPALPPVSAPTVDPPPSRQRTALVGLCLVVMAVLAAIVVAATV